MLTLQEIQKEMSELDDWSLTGSSIEKNFSFTNFKESMDFVNDVGKISEDANHHPDILITFDQVRLSLTTHTDVGLSKKDFTLAKEIDKIEK